MDKSITVPDHYKVQLEELLNNLEKETGQIYQFTVNQFGFYSNINMIIGDFTKRNLKIEVYEIDPEYSELLGIYNCREEFQNKIETLRCNEVFEEIKEIKWHKDDYIQIGKCKKCKSYNEGKKKYSPNYIRADLCQNCHADFRTKWWRVTISKNDYTIYTSEGGRMSICTMIGKYRFVD